MMMTTKETPICSLSGLDRFHVSSMLHAVPLPTAFMARTSHRPFPSSDSDGVISKCLLPMARGRGPAPPPQQAV